MKLKVQEQEIGREEQARLYRRLFQYTKPYKWRLLAGIIAGIISAGSLFVIFDNANDAVASFRASGQFSTQSPEPEARSPESEARSPEPKAQEPVADIDGRAARPFAAAEDEQTVGRRVPAPQSATKSKDDKKVDDKLAKIEKFFEKHGIKIKIRNTDGSITWQGLALVLCVIPVFLIIRIGTTVLNHYFMRWVGAAVVRDVRNDIFSTLQKQSLKYYGNSDIGELISRCVNDTATVEHVISSTVANAARAPFEILAVIIWAAAYSIENEIGRFVLSIGIFLPLCVLPIIILGQKVKRWTKRSLERISFVVSRMHENFTGIRVVKAFNTEKYEEDRFHKLNHEYFRAVVKTLKAEILMSPLMEAVIAVIAMAFVVVCFICKVDLIKVGMVATAVYMAYRPLKEIAQINAWLQRGAAALGRIFNILDADTSLPEAANPFPKKSFDDKIVFNHVDYSFSPEGPAVVTDATFEVPHGALVALVGETGSGKSTYANLLARFYDPVKGTVTIDGINLRDIATSDLRKLIGVVTQDTILFNDTIESNIAYGTEGATHEQVVAAAKMANAHDFIVAHPEGYDRICGEKGFVLSGGEKQRVALARAILKNPPILILDEATSALDTVTERLVQDAITKVMANRTVFAIAHRLSTVRDADCILVIEKGRIVESGTHKELYEKGGRYRRLCDMQLQG